MKIIISPAKKIASDSITIGNSSQIKFSDEAIYLAEQLKSYSVEDIKVLMGLSDNLAKLNYDRFQKWDLKSKDIHAAIYMFQGDVYQGIELDTFNSEELMFAQNNLRIISGLYGLLKPLDSVLPYRLEMGTKLKTKMGDDLYQFWGDKLNKSLSSEMKSNETLVNLASNEYSKAIKLENLNHSFVTPVFKDLKNGKLKVVSFFAKKARGKMVNFIIKNKITSVSDLKLFSSDGYEFHDENDSEIVFCR